MQKTDLPQPRGVVVALLDVLGFSARVGHTGLELLVADYRDLIERKKRASALPTFSPIGVSMANVKSTIFSDTILLWSDATLAGWNDLSKACALLMAYAIDGGWPLRGGIACGQAVIDISTRCFVGQPIVDAYRTEQSQEWIGVGIHASVGAHLALGAPALTHEDVIAYPVPTKRGAPPILHAIHWGPYSGQASSEIAKLVQSAPDCRARRKYATTIEYIRMRCSGTHASS